MIAFFLQKENLIKSACGSWEALAKFNFFLITANLAFIAPGRAMVLAYKLCSVLWASFCCKVCVIIWKRLARKKVTHTHTHNAVRKSVSGNDCRPASSINCITLCAKVLHAPPTEASEPSKCRVGQHSIFRALIRSLLCTWKLLISGSVCEFGLGSRVTKMELNWPVCIKLRI